ncbi:MAG: amino acid deaminase, partial [Glaciihabitans sp.]|nr:amino acid deaminase [Glaciihabitans sp.]
RRLGVCVELGVLHARTGARTSATARAVAEAVVASPHLELRGVSGYEGSVPGEPDEEKVVAIRAFLARMADTFTELEPLFEISDPILTAGGSAYFDLVVEAFTGVPKARVIIRSGAYVVHDDGIYRRSTPAATRTGPVLQASVNVWARVISAPEPHLVLLDVGKRDVPYDSGLPEVQAVLRGGAAIPLPGRIEFTGTNDQHGYLRINEPGDLRVGDVVKLGLSHPCTMFDKWRSVLLIEDSTEDSAEDSGVDSGVGFPRVRGAIRTFF